MSPTPERDPFASSVDPGAYVPRPVTEAVLERLERGFRGGDRIQVLGGPPGLGKTLLVRVLEERLAPWFEVVYVPYGAMTFGDLAVFVLGQLGETPGSLPDRELLGTARLRSKDGRPLLLAIDDASSMPLDCASALAALVEEAEGALRLLVVPVDDARAGRVHAALAPGVVQLRLNTPMTLEETRDYVAARLAAARAPHEERERFDDALVGRLHSASGGNPRELHQFAAEVQRGNLRALPAAEADRELESDPATSPTALELDPADVRAAALPRDVPIHDGPSPFDPSHLPEDDDHAQEHEPAPEPRSAAGTLFIVTLLSIAVGFALLWVTGYFPAH